MNHTGMSIIVKVTARLITGFAVVFGVYLALTGHLAPGGGFAGGVILAAAAGLVVLAFGKEFSKGVITDRQCHAWDGLGAMAFLAVALLGYSGGVFFVNFIMPAGRVGRLFSAGTIPIANLAILVKVGAGLAGAFLALAAYRRYPKGDL